MNAPDTHGPLSPEEELRILLAREQAAREKAERSTLYFQTLFEAAPSKFAVLRMDDFQIVSVSQAYLDAAMVRREDIVGKTLFDAFPDDPADPSAEGVRNVRATLERVKESGVTTVTALQRYPVRRPDGEFEERYWSAVNTPVKGPKGELAFILHRVEDVTEFVRAKAVQGKEEEALQSLEERATHLELDIFLRAKEQRELAEELERERTRLVTAQRVAKVGSWEADMATRQVACSDETLRIFEVDPATSFPHSRASSLSCIPTTATRSRMPSCGRWRGAKPACSSTG